MNDDADFWRQLAADFRALPSMRAEWTQVAGTGTPRRWTLAGAPVTVRLRFTVLAKRGALTLASSFETGLLSIWLDAIYDQFSVEPGGYGYHATGGVQLHEHGGRISHICERSSDLCTMLESQALELRADLHVLRDDADGVADPVTEEAESQAKDTRVEQSAGTPVETVAGQINRLRGECRLTVEQLAEKIKIGSRSVYRHLNGQSMPRDGHIGAYERIFSILLKRMVLISKTSVKRH